jgi:hypothetical protein
VEIAHPLRLLAAQRATEACPGCLFLAGRRQAAK